MKKLRRSSRNRIFSGVCGGLGEFFHVDPTIFRLLFLLFAFGPLTSVPLYLLLTLVLPSDQAWSGGPGPDEGHRPDQEVLDREVYQDIRRRGKIKEAERVSRDGKGGFEEDESA